jgi:hypothetical protein
MDVQFYGFYDSNAEELIRTELFGVAENRIRSVSISFNQDPKWPLPVEDFKVLILWEPAAVMPWQYKKKNLGKFDFVLPMSSWRAKKLGLESYCHHPYLRTENIVSPFNSRESVIVMINAPKFSASTESNYGLRRQVSRQLYESGVKYELFGPNWKMNKRTELRKRLTALRNSLKALERIDLGELSSNMFYSYPEHRGEVAQKISILSKSNLSLVIENQSDFVTEKVFDSIVAGAVPVYVGPDLSKEFPALNDCLITVEPDADKIVNRILNLGHDELLTKKRAIVDFFNRTEDDSLEYWSPNRQWKRCGQLIRKELTRF